MKYRKQLLYNKKYQGKLRELLAGIAERYWYVIHRLGTDGDHIHIFLQAAPDESVSTIVKTIKSITTREMYTTFPELKKMMWGTKLSGNRGILSEALVMKQLHRQSCATLRSKENSEA